jgi:hypothetical protein
MTNRPSPESISIPAAIQAEVFDFLDITFAPGIRHPNSHVDWIALRDEGYRSLVAMVCLLHFVASVFVIFDCSKVRLEDHPDLVLTLAVFTVLASGIVLWSHRVVYRLFMFRARGR